MTIKARGATFQVDLTHKGKRYRVGGFTDTTLAAIYEADARSALLQGKPLPPGPGEVGRPRQQVERTLSELYEIVFKRVWEGTKGERPARFAPRSCLDFLGYDTPVKEITEVRLSDLRAHLKEQGLKPATIQNKFAYLLRMLNYAHRPLKWIDEVPDHERFKRPQGRLGFLTDAEEEAILNWFDRRVPSYPFSALFRFLVETGARLGEAEALRYSDLGPNLETATFWITKGGKPRTVYLTTRARSALRQVMAEERIGRVFPPFRRPWLSERWQRMRFELGMPDDVVVHTFRHTCASRLVQDGVDIRTVQEWLGHSTIAMTMRYAHLAPNSLEKCASSLEARASGRVTEEAKAA